MNRLYGAWLPCALSLGLICFGLAVRGQTAGPSQIWLVTPEEAALPPAAEAASLTRGAPTEISREVSDLGPLIEILKPTEGVTLSSPTEITVRFTPKGDPIDWGTLHIWLVKLINIDITDRVRPYVTSGGIEIPDAQLPRGHHTVRISLADMTGGLTVMNATLTIE